MLLLSKLVMNDAVWRNLKWLTYSYDLVEVYKSINCIDIKKNSKINDNNVFIYTYVISIITISFCWLFICMFSSYFYLLNIIMLEFISHIFCFFFFCCKALYIYTYVHITFSLKNTVCHFEKYAIFNFQFNQCVFEKKKKKNII